jgi:hypothetical protein
LQKVDIKTSEFSGLETKKVFGDIPSDQSSPILLIVKSTNRVDFGNYQYDPSVDMSGYIPLSKRKQKEPSNPQNSIVNEQSLLDPNFKFPLEALKEKQIIQLACQIKNLHPYGTTSIGGNISDPAFPDDFPLVGSSEKQKSPYCNSYSLGKGKTEGCLETDQHQAQFLEKNIYHVTQLDGRCLPGQIIVKPSAYHCSDPECPFCAKYWAGKTTAKAVRRIETFLNLTVNSFNVQFNNKTKAKGKSKPFVFGVSKEDYDLPFSSIMEIRHNTVSIPKTDWKLPYNVKKKNAETVLFMAGAQGACQFYHPKRWSKTKKTWFYSPHFHFLAVVPNGWLDGDLISIINGETGYVIKNLPGDRTEKHEQIKTLMYQLSHAGVPFGHQHAVTWIGCLAYNQLSVPKVTTEQLEDAKEKCPLCGNSLRPIAHKSYSVKDKNHEKPIWNKHPILNSKYDQKFCVVSPNGWEYLPEYRKKSDSDSDYNDDENPSQGVKNE